MPIPCCCLWVAVVLAAGPSGEAVWQEYVGAARRAERTADDLTAERAWSAAAEQLFDFPKDDPRRALTLAHWALAMTRTDKRASAAEKIKQAETLLAGLDPLDVDGNPRRQQPPVLEEARGTWAWAAARDSAERASRQRAHRFGLAVRLLPELTLGPVRRAELLEEAALAQVGSGQVRLASRQAAEAVKIRERAQPGTAALAETLIIAALAHLEAGRAELATGAIAQAGALQSRLRDRPAKERPSEPAFLTIAARVALRSGDRDALANNLERLGVGTGEELSVGTHAVVSQFDMLAIWLEAQLVDNEPLPPSVPKILERLKTLAGADSERRGSLAILQGDVATHEGRIHEGITAFTQALKDLDPSLESKHVRLIIPLTTLSQLQVSAGEDTAALATARRAVSLGSELPAGHPLRVGSLVCLAEVELMLQHPGEAVRLATTALDHMRIAEASGNPASTESSLRAILADAEAQWANRISAAQHLAALKHIPFHQIPLPRRILLHWHAGHAAHLLDDLGSARFHYEKAIQLARDCIQPPETHPFAAAAALCLVALDCRSIVPLDGKETGGPEYDLAWKLLVKNRKFEARAAQEVSRHANAFFTAEQYRESIWLYDRAIEAYSRLNGDQSPFVDSLKTYRAKAIEKAKSRTPGI